MGRSLWVEPTHRVSNESCSDEVHSRAAKISFSSKVKLPPLEDWGRNRNEAQGTKRELFFARIGGFPEDGLRWVAERFKNVVARDNASLHGLPRQRRVCVSRRRGLTFARVADRFDPGTQEKLEEVREELEDVKEDVVETAQKARVPVPAADVPYIGFIHSLTIKDLLCGVLAGAVASTVVVPFDIIRTRVIAGQGGQSFGQVWSTVAREEGLQTLFKGDLTFNILKNAAEKGLQFTTFEYVKRNQEQGGGRQKKILPLPRQIPLATAGGAAAGLVGTLLSYPLQPIFDRVILEPERYKGGLLDTLKQITQHEGGVRELYRGLTPALISIVPNAAVSFYSYETLKSRLLSKKRKNTKNSKQELEALLSLVIGGVAGAVSTAVTYPLELARKEILLSAFQPSAVMGVGAVNVYYNNTWQALNGIVKSQGVKGLYRGMPAQILQMAPMTAITFMVYELAKRAFVASGEERRDEVKDADDL